MTPHVARALVLIWIAENEDRHFAELAYYLMNCWCLDHDEGGGNLLVQLELARLWDQIDHTPRCGTCGSHMYLRRVFNGGNPMSFWDADCGCDDELMEAKVDEMIERMKRRQRPGG